MKPFHVRSSQDQQQQPKLNLANNTTSNNKKASATSNNAIDVKLLEQQRQLFTIKELSDNFPTYILKDDPKPAIFIARKLFVDFVKLVGDKIELILNQENRTRPLFKSLQRNEDPIYDQILEAIGSISEYCLPSTLSILIDWYHHQLKAGGESAQRRPQSLIEGQQAGGCDHQAQSVDCGSPPGQDSVLSMRSPTPSSPDTSSTQQVTITSTLSLEYQSPSLTVVAEPHSSSAANTSTSTATNVSSNSLIEDSTITTERLELIKTRKLLIEYAFCQALIEIFNQLYLHPGHEDLIGQIEDIAFDHFKYVEPGNNSHEANTSLLADKYAEVIGVLARTRFKRVRKRFMSELSSARSRDPTPFNVQSIVTLLYGIKFFRVKMAPIEEFEASFQFLQECAEYFLEVRHKSVKHALACLFVEIMMPLSSSVKNEVKIPCLKNFVDLLWSQTLDMCSRKKHSITFFPLVTCLLCLSQRAFFLTNWGIFLNMCLSNLKNRDQKMCRVALESLYRLIWIYMIRIKCESNNVTQSRLQSIVDALFPRGSRTVIPRDAPLNIFVDIIQFIAQERLDFAMRHIIFDLLSVDRPFKVIMAPERMNIALQAFLAIADSLQHKDGEPPMPKLATDSSDTSEAVGSRRAHVSKMLSDEVAKSIGLFPYYGHIQRSFNDILKALDAQYGRPLLLTVAHNTNKEPDDMITGERRPKIELFKTCVAAMPRLMPEGMSRPDLIELLWRMTIHVDEEMRKIAFECLQTLVVDYADWRLDAIEGFTSFLANQVDESLRNLVDGALGMLLEILVSWRQVITSSGSLAADSARSSLVSIQTGHESISSRTGGTGGQIAAKKSRALAEMRLIQSELSSTRFDRLVTVLQKVEGAALVMLCNCHQPTRRLAGQLLRESRAIIKCYTSWTCMEQFGFRSPDELDQLDEQLDQMSVSLRGSLSADNLSRITALSTGGPAHSSIASMNTQAFLSASVSKMCISNSQQLRQQQQQHLSNHSQHDPYDSDIESNLADCLSASDDNSDLVFWFAVIMLESRQEREYTFALRLLKRILPDLPFEQPQYVEEIERTLEQMRWPDFPGIQALVLRGCNSVTNYDTAISLLDHLTPIMKLRICSGQRCSAVFPAHVMALLSHLLANYEDPKPLSLNIARRIAIWCEENYSASGKLENLSTVMQLYSRRSFSKDAFQWTKCVVKYLYDAFPETLPETLPLLVELLELAPAQVQRLIAPILYCMLTYVDLNGLAEGALQVNNLLGRIYAKYLAISVADGAGGYWRDALQLFKLIISRASQLPANQSSSHNAGELPGRTMDFSLDVQATPVIAGARLGEALAVEQLDLDRLTAARRTPAPAPLA